VIISIEDNIVLRSWYFIFIGLLVM